MRLSRTGVATWVLGAVVLGLRLPAADETLAAAASPAFPVALRSCLDLVLVAVAAWAVVALGACAVGGSTARLGRHLVPRALRGALLAGVLTGMSLGAAHAASDPSVDRPGTTVLDGLRLPDRPTSDRPVSLAPEASPTGRGEQPPSTVVLVAPGDTLWSIAASHLPPGASDADVAAAVHRWYAANREVVGADPDLIRPGQRLEAPAGAA